MRPIGLQVVETYCPGGLTCVKMRNPAGEWVEVWKGEPQRSSIPDKSRIFSPPITPPAFETDAVRLGLEQGG